MMIIKTINGQNIMINIVYKLHAYGIDYENLSLI